MQNKLAIFAGAGVSRLIDCPSWKELAGKLIACHTTLNYRDQQTLSEFSDPKKIITICRNLLPPDDFRSTVAIALKGTPDRLLKDGSAKLFDIYGMLREIGNTFITTNLDEHFDGEFLEIKYNETDFVPLIKDDTLYHIHGSVKDHSQTILTTKDYLKRYNDPKFKNFLQNLFRERTVLFVGYGLTEFEVLDSLNLGITPQKHFILEGYSRYADEQLKFNNSYYNELGIQSIGYDMDEIGHDQLFKVIKDWHTKLVVAPVLPSGYPAMALINKVVV